MSYDDLTLGEHLKLGGRNWALISQHGNSCPLVVLSVNWGNFALSSQEHIKFSVWGALRLNSGEQDM